MIKIKFRNTRDNKPTFKLDDLTNSGLFDASGFTEGDQLTLRLVNKAGITADTTFTVDVDDETGLADGWNVHVNPLERNNRPFEVGVCYAEEGDEITKKFGSDSAPDEEDFEEVEEEDDFENFDDEDDDFEEEEEAVAAPVAKPRLVASVSKPRSTVDVYDITKSEMKRLLAQHNGNKAALARTLETNPRTLGRALDKLGLGDSGSSSSRAPAKKSSAKKSSKIKKAASKKRR